MLRDFYIAIKSLLLSLVICTFSACQTKKKEAHDSSVFNHSLDKGTPVLLNQAKKGDFAVKVLTNGRVTAGQEVQLSFSATGLIKKIFVQNGMAVKSTQLLAILENSDQSLAVKQAEIHLKESEIELNDQLIVQGGIKGDSASVNPEVFNTIKIRSGYGKALLDLKKARMELEKTKLIAPVDGVIANLALNEYNFTPTEKPFCTLINRSEMIIRCPILETELSIIQAGQSATIIPVGLGSTIYTGKVKLVNPIVNEQGLTEIVIKVLNPDSRLLSGMNTRVIIEKKIPNQLMVPKIAVLERSGKKVVFVYENGKAKWHYVTTGAENDEFITITEGLESAMKVIVSGHLNLGHDALVIPVENLD